MVSGFDAVTGLDKHSLAEFEVKHSPETAKVAVASLRLSFLWALIVWLPSARLVGVLYVTVATPDELVVAVPIVVAAVSS
jgi:hypothetical protein